MVVIIGKIRFATFVRKKRICKTKHCRNYVKCSGSKCSTCRSREYTKRNPIRRCFRNLKSNAKRRGKVFELTFEQFEEFAIRTDYINKRGIMPDGYTIDRRDNSKGYTIDNIRILPNKDNVQKYLTIDRFWDGRKMNFYTSAMNMAAFDNNLLDCPF
jgi:hypothetical protein